MTNIRVVITKGINPPHTNIRTVRKWGDPVLVELLKADVNLVGTTNFQVVKTATLDSNGIPFFNDTARFQRVDYSFLESLQYPSDGFTVQQKMNWLVNHGGAYVRPYWKKDSDITYFGPLVFGGQRVQLGESITAMGVFPNEPTGTPNHPILFHRLIGLRKSEYQKVYTGEISYQTTPHLIQRATEAGSNNRYTDFPRGEIFHPVWSDIDWPCNYGDGKLWIADKFLE